MAGGSSDDARILVRCGENEMFLDSLEDTLYQGARGLYMQNLPQDWKTQPVGQDLGAMMTNAVSILFETVIGRTPQFFDFIAVRAEGVFRQFKNESFEPENLYRLKKVITPSALRNDADELSKIFHDLLRYRIEKDLINGKLDVKDLPDRGRRKARIVWEQSQRPVRRPATKPGLVSPGVSALLPPTLYPTWSPHSFTTRC